MTDWFDSDIPKDDNEKIINGIKLIMLTMEKKK